MNRHLCLSSGLLALALAGCLGTGHPEYVNPGIAERYSEFYRLSGSKPQEARLVIKKLVQDDPDNAYTQYLLASLEAQEKNFEAALALLDRANAMEKNLIFVSAPPPEDSMQTLTRLRQMSASTASPDAREALKDRIADYFKAVRVMGARVAQAEPVCSLSVLNGAGIVRRAYRSEVEHWTTLKDESKRSAVTEAMDEYDEWYSGLSKELGESLKDIMREAGKMAGLNEEEMEQYAKGMDLKDKGKQAKAEEARKKIYAAEVEVLRKGIARMPSP